MGFFDKLREVANKAVDSVQSVNDPLPNETAKQYYEIVYGALGSLKVGASYNALKKYVEFYNEPKDIKKIFGVPKFVFDAQFKAYVKEKYKDEEKMQNIMEDKKLDEVVPEFKEIKEPEQEKGQVIQELTEIHFTKSGGAEINEPKLENLDEPQIKM